MKNKLNIFRIAFSQQRATRGGFTLIELLVVVSIYAIISGVVISNYRDYTANAVSLNAPEDIVLALRQAQVYGASGRGNSVSCGVAMSLFDCQYGVSFTAKAGFEKGFTIFADVNGDNIYNAGDIEVETVTWKDASVITQVECLPNIGGCSSGVLNVTFKRPSPDAIIGGGYEKGRITVWNGVTGTGSKTRVVTISKAGQISIQ